MRDVEGRIGVDNVDTSRFQFLARGRVLGFAGTPCGIEHDANVHAAFFRVDDCGKQIPVGKKEHLDAEGLFCLADGREQRSGSVVGKHDELMRH